jgi:uncharacterized protein (DUF1778 family)
MDSYRGSGFVVWLADDKLKFKFCKDQDDLVKEAARLKAIVSPKFILISVINWDDESVEYYTAKEELENAKS